MTTFDPLYTVAEAAKLLSVSADFIYDRIHVGEIEVVELGTTRKNQRIRQSALEAYIASRTIPASR